MWNAVLYYQCEKERMQSSIDLANTTQCLQSITQISRYGRQTISIKWKTPRLWQTLKSHSTYFLSGTADQYTANRIYGNPISWNCKKNIPNRQTEWYCSCFGGCFLLYIKEWIGRLKDDYNTNSKQRSESPRYI